MNRDLDKNEHEIEQHLKSQFQQFNAQEELPEDLKDEVFSTLDSFTLVSDFFDLFTVKFGSTEAQIVDTISDHSINNIEEE